jgi:hypothetical protein
VLNISLFASYYGIATRGGDCLSDRENAVLDLFKGKYRDVYVKTIGDIETVDKLDTKMRIKRWVARVFVEVYSQYERHFTELDGTPFGKEILTWLDETCTALDRLGKV